MNLQTINKVTSFFSDKGSNQISTATNAAKAQSDPLNVLTKRCNYSFGLDQEGHPLSTPEVTGDFIALAYLRRGADVMWHNIEILADADSDTFTCEIGTLDAEGNFTNRATMGTPVDFVGTATIPAPTNEALEDASWIVAKITGTPPTSGVISTYIPWISLA
ncbi:hypothetical protein OAI07_01330 [Akkermansiaceae bacterium]|nr:hypothetical protein [Akkermansiaceae bacterium]